MKRKKIDFCSLSLRLSGLPLNKSDHSGERPLLFCLLSYAGCIAGAFAFLLTDACRG